MKKTLFIIGLLFSLITLSAQDKVAILCFHSFWGNHPEYPYDFSEEHFASILDQLSKAGFKFVTTEELIANTIIGDRNILVTIDDGNESVYKTYFNILKPRNIRPLLAIICGAPGSMKQVLTWDQIAELKNDGCYIAAHGYFHLMMNDKLHQMSPELFSQEVYKSHEVLMKHGFETLIFVYPYGKVIPEAEEMVRDSYVLGMGLGMKSLDLPLGPDTNLMNIPRYMFDQKNYQSIIDSLKDN